MSKVLVIGGGAAGMVAAIFAARNGHEVHIFEKNEKFGKKIYITGKGRCNLTNNCEMEELFQSVMRNEKFLYSAFYSFSNQDVMEFFAQGGCAVKTERGNRVFPISDHASDVIACLVRGMKEAGVSLHLNSEAVQLQFDGTTVAGVRLKDGTIISGDRVIVSTGGMSYPSTGSTVDGYRFAEFADHHVTRLLPSLVPFEIQEAYVKELQGLSLRNVEVTIYQERKKIYQNFGEMLFTHFGVSGPIILSGSAHLLRYKDIDRLLKESKIKLIIDLKPALSEEELDKRIIRDFEEFKNKEFKNSLDRLLPKKMIDVVINLSQINYYKKVNEITKEERNRIVKILKNFEITIGGFRPVEEAIVTAGGISTKEINPKTMESKKVKGLYFAGEVIDVDAYTGGFNLQIAYSTGYTAGLN